MQNLSTEEVRKMAQLFTAELKSRESVCEISQNELSPEEVSVSRSVKGVCFDSVRSRWRASWHENGRERAKYFAVRIHGEDKARELAVEHRRNMEETGRAQRKSGHLGVTWSRLHKSWEAVIFCRGRKVRKSFSVKRVK